MDTSIPALGACALALALAGCAAPQPVPFQLVDAASKVHRGTLFPQTGHIEVAVEGSQYSGFYIIAAGYAVSQPTPFVRRFPYETITTYATNEARATLSDASGRRLNCQFLVEGLRAIGECRSPDGTAYQMVAEGK